MYRIIVGEKGNTHGHVVETSAKTLTGAKRVLTRELNEYGRDGWGHIQEAVDTDDGIQWRNV